jgi:peptidoglycan-associated lipoprotein
MTGRTVALALIVLTSFAGTEGCRKKVEPAPTPAADPGSADDAAARHRADSLAALADAQRRADSLAALRAAGSRDAAGAQTELRNVLAQKVYFDYDKDQLRDDATATLDAKAAVLLANPAITLVVTGHTDERGTAEYNLALGQRRAAQVKRYLASRGVGEGRLTTRSLGDSQPAVMGTDEAAYQQNRRAEFEVRNAPGALVRPRP